MKSTVISNYYDLIFKKRDWIRRLTEKVHIEDPQDTKKSCTFDVAIPFNLLRWNQVEYGMDNPYASPREILPLMFVKKSTIKDIDVTINGYPLSITTKNFNKKIEKLLKEESNRRLQKQIENISDSKMQKISKELKKQIEIIFNGVNGEHIEGEGRVKPLEVLIEELESKPEYKELKGADKLKELKKGTGGLEELKNKLNSHYFIYRLFSQYFLFSVLLPIDFHGGERVIIKVSFELPNKNFSTNQYYNKFKDILKVFSSKYVQDELEYEFETISLPYSHHVLIDLPKGIKATDFRYAYKDNSDGTDKPGLLYTRNINGDNYDFYNINNIKKGKIYINKDLKPRITKEGELKASIVKYRVIPEDQGIKRWSFILSFVVPLLVAFGILANFNDLAKGESERSAIVTVLATFSVLFIVWMAKGVEIPIYARTVLPLRISILLYLIGTYTMIIVVIIGDGSNIRINDSIDLPVWSLGWMCIYAIFSAATGYSLIVHIYYYSLRLEHMYWGIWWKVLRQGCIYVGVLGPLVLIPIICFLIACWNLCNPVVIFEWVILCINIIYLFPVSIIGVNKTFRPNPNLKSKSTM